MNPLLEKLMNGAPAANAGPSPMTGPPKPRLQKLNYTHEAMIAAIIHDPCVYTDDLAEMFDRTPSWISTILHSDIFQSKLAAERERLTDPELRASLKLQFTGLLARSMEILRKKLDVPPEKVPDQLAVQVAKLAGTSLGFGVKETRVSVQETHLHLTELGDNLVGLLRQRKAAALTQDQSSRADFGPGRIIDVQENGSYVSSEGARTALEQDQGGSSELPAARDFARSSA